MGPALFQAPGLSRKQCRQVPFLHGGYVPARDVVEFEVAARVKCKYTLGILITWTKAQRRSGPEEKI